MKIGQKLVHGSQARLSWLLDELNRCDPNDERRIARLMQQIRSEEGILAIRQKNLAEEKLNRADGEPAGAASLGGDCDGSCLCPEPNDAASLTERLIQAAVDYESGRCSRRELSEARAAVEAAILAPAQRDALA